MENQGFENEMFRRKEDTSARLILHALTSAGNNNEKLARIMTAYDLAMSTLGWKNRDISIFSKLLSEYQASLDGKYHNDFKEVLIAEEIEKRKQNRKGFSITHNE